LARAVRGQQVACDSFGAPVHRRTIQDGATQGEQRAENGVERRSFLGARANIEPFVGAYPDDGQRFAAGRYDSSEHGAVQYSPTFSLKLAGARRGQQWQIIGLHGFANVMPWPQFAPAVMPAARANLP